jgi:type II secretory pathway pseudopilin PulG
MIKATDMTRARRRSGITLTEILIAILIMGVGLVSLATLFPIGLLRLRDASRYSRSTYLAQAASADLSSRSLLSNTSFLNTLYYNTPAFSGLYSPFLQDTPSPGGDWAGAGATTGTSPGAYSGPGGVGLPNSVSVGNANGSGNTTYPPINGPGLPFAYDPLWRYLTVNTATSVQGYPPYANSPFEARFGSGIGFIQNDPDGGVPSAHGLQRITNFNPALFPLLYTVIPSIFVSPEDVVWQEPTNQNYFMANNSVVFNAGSTTPAVGSSPSPVIPDMSLSGGTQRYPPLQTNDFHYSWMFTGQLVNSSNQACFDGNIVVFENRPFGISTPPVIPNAPGATSNLQVYQVDGETVVEAFFGYSGNIQFVANFNTGYAAGADRTVLLRWSNQLPDPSVKAGDWIADVTYERSQATVQSRWWQTNNIPTGFPNLVDNSEWDNLPAQRCYWYQVQKVAPATADPYTANYRSMVVYVNQSLQSRTAFTAAGSPSVRNAALIMPSVVNVIPTTIFTR